MRVLIVPKWYPSPDRPVFGIFCREQALSIAPEHDVIVLASEAVTAPPFALFSISDAVEEGLRTIRVRYRRPRVRPAAMGAQLAGMLVALWRLRRAGWRPQLVHAHVYSAGLPALVLGRLSGAPVVISEHFTGFQRGLITGYDRFTARAAFRGADLVAPVSADLAGYVRAVQPKARIRVVENVVDTAVFHPAGDGDRRSDRARLLTVGSLSQKKGHADLLRALATLGDGEPPTLELVGEGELRGELERLAERLGLAGSVRFRGELPKLEVAELMRAVDLFVLPSRSENLPCVLIEAMASGLPSVATAVGGVPGLIDGAPAAGILCPPSDPEALAAAITRALRSRQEVDPGALAERARARFGYEAIGSQWSEIYAGLSSAGRTSSATIRRIRSGR